MSNLSNVINDLVGGFKIINLPPESKNILLYPRSTIIVAACGAIRSSSSYNIIILPF
jgi:hypothetical protein